MLDERLAHVDLLRRDLWMPPTPCGDSVTVGPFVADDLSIAFDLVAHVRF